MCVKDFYGFSCGHCSVPLLRRCPLSLSNDMFPVCEFPAERPHFTDTYCHPCSRVVWNTKVLEEEEEHRRRHQRGECVCEVIFDVDERERRARPRSSKSRSKGTGRELKQRNLTSEAGENNEALDMASSRAERESSREESERAHMRGVRADVHIEHHRSLSPSTTGNFERTSVGDSRAITVRVAVDESVGNSIGQDEQGCDDHDPSFNIRGAAFQHHQAAYWNDQSMMGQVGAGMKWYSQDVMPPLPVLPPLPPQLWTDHQRAPMVWQKALSEPTPDLEYPGVEANEFSPAMHVDPNSLQKPMVVSSDMGRVNALC